MVYAALALAEGERGQPRLRVVLALGLGEVGHPTEGLHDGIAVEQRRGLGHLGRARARARVGLGLGSGSGAEARLGLGLGSRLGLGLALE